jgi:flagellar assembly protein FliH
MTSSDKDTLVTEQADVLSAEEIADAFERWEAPTMVSISDVEESELAIPTAEELEQLRKAAQDDGFRDGFEKGRHDGLIAGQQEIQQQVSELQTLISRLNQPLLDIEAVIEEQVTTIITLLLKQLVRNELATKPEHIIAAFRAAMSQLPLNNRQLKIRLHPDDLEIVKQGLASDETQADWRWVADQNISRGGLEFESIDTRIDATVETRLDSAIEKLIGEIHSDDQAE